MRQLNKIHKSIILINIKENNFSLFFLLHFRKIEELEAQLEFERLKREKREAELDECRNEILRLINTLRSCEDKMLHSQVRFSLDFNLNYSIYFI